jgi:transposase InsO family protein
MSDHPWEKVKVDFYRPLPSGHYAVVVIDCYSRFPEVEILKSISAKKVIPKLHSIFARHSIPAQLVSDNGPPFQGHEFNQYMTAMGIKHSTSTPLWPQGNAEPEAFMKPLGKLIRSAHLEKRPWQQELSKFLLSYRQTPHSITKVPPASTIV